MESVNFKERLAIIEPLIMNEGMTYQKIVEVTGLTWNQIIYTIDALNRPKTDIYDAEKYKVLKAKISENAKSHSKEEIQEKEYQDYLDKIEYQIEENKLILEICKNLSITNTIFHKIVNSLNNPNSSNYNPTRYKRLKAQMEQNANERRSEIASINKSTSFLRERSNFKLEITKKVANGEMIVYDAANELHMSIYDFFLYILELKDTELKNSLRKILQPYGVFLNENSTKDIMAYPLKIQKEIVLLALTYRVSYKTIAKIFGVSMKNVIETFKTFTDLTWSLDFLFLETYAEDEIHEKKAYNDAMLYWRKRNEIISSLNEATKKQQGEKINQFKIELKQLRTEIDDSLLFQIKGKKAKSLTEEERNFIAKYQLKYYLSFDECGRQLGYDDDTIERCNHRYAEKNPIFAEKMVLHSKVFYDTHQRIREQYSSNFSRGGGF